MFPSQKAQQQEAARAHEMTGARGATVVPKPKLIEELNRHLRWAGANTYRGTARRLVVAGPILLAHEARCLHAEGRRYSMSLAARGPGVSARGVVHAQELNASRSN